MKMKVTTVIVCFVLPLVLAVAAKGETPLTVEWIRQLGTSSFEECNAVAVDAMGNAYISGYTEGSLEGISAGSYDAFLTKYDRTGNELWTQQFGSSSGDFSNSVAVEAAGNVYISGTTEGSLVGTSNSGYDAFLRKYDSAGNELWTNQIHTGSYDEGNSVVVDFAGNVYIGGSTEGNLEGTSAGDYDAYVIKYNSAGNELWRQQLGSDRDDGSSSIAVDTAGSVYICGDTWGRMGETYEGNIDAFLTKFDSAGNVLWTQQFGTYFIDRGRGVAVDGVGDIYVTGTTAGSLDGTSTSGGIDAYLRKYDRAGNVLWTQQFGAGGDASSVSVAVDAVGAVYITGHTNTSLGGNTEVFLRKYDSAGNELWTEQLGTNGSEFTRSVALDAVGNAYISGSTTGDFDGVSAGDYDAFLVKFSAVPEPSTTAILLTAAPPILARIRRRAARAHV